MAHALATLDGAKCIQKFVTKRQVNNEKFFGSGMLTFMLATLCLMVAIARPAKATPIHPTAEQLLRQTQRPVMPYVPAQAGWQDSDSNRPDIDEEAAGIGHFNTTEILRDAEAARTRRAILVAIGRPDPRVLLAFAAVIFLLRKMRTVREGAGVPTPIQAPSH